MIEPLVLDCRKTNLSMNYKVEKTTVEIPCSVIVITYAQGCVKFLANIFETSALKGPARVQPCHMWFSVSVTHLSWFCSMKKIPNDLIF